MLLGYVRTSTDEQTTRLQLYALQAVGCERTFTERASDARPLPHLIDVVRHIDAGDVGLRSLTEGIDAATSDGWLAFLLFESWDQFGRDLIREWTQPCLVAAKARGRKGGRPPKLSLGTLRITKKLLRDRESTISAVARTLGVHRSPRARR